MSLGEEYRKCKYGIPDGISLDCDAFKKYSASCEAKGRNLLRCIQSQKEKNCAENVESEEDSRQSHVVELLLQDHKSEKESTSCCSQTESTKVKENDECEETKKKIENICMEYCIKNLPDCLPEEEKLKTHKRNNF